MPADLFANAIPTIEQLWRIACYAVGTLAAAAILGGVWAFVDTLLTRSRILGRLEQSPVQRQDVFTLHVPHRNGFRTNPRLGKRGEFHWNGQDVRR